MSTGRFVAPGKTRSCPHCKATILDSAAVCPGCHHHLRFDSVSGQRAQSTETPLRVDGILRHPANGGAWEYSIVLAIRNGRGEEISRQVVGVGALQPAEVRTFSLAVEVFKPAEVQDSKPQAAAAPPPRPADPRAPGRITLPGQGAEAPSPTSSSLPRHSPGASLRPSPRPQTAVRDLGSPTTGAAAQQPLGGGLKDPRLPAADPKLHPKRQ